MEKNRSSTWTANLPVTMLSSAVYPAVPPHPLILFLFLPKNGNRRGILLYYQGELSVFSSSDGYSTDLSACWKSKASQHRHWRYVKDALGTPYYSPESYSWAGLPLNLGGHLEGILPDFTAWMEALSSISQTKSKSGAPFHGDALH